MTTKVIYLPLLTSMSHVGLANGQTDKRADGDGGGVRADGPLERLGVGCA